MGDIFTAKCQCGFKSRELTVGRGMMHAHPYYLPVACPACHVIWTVDSRRGCRTCRKCHTALYYLHEGGSFIPADVLKRLKVDYPWNLDNTEEEVESMPKVRYLCPRRGIFEMALLDAGCWD